MRLHWLRKWPARLMAVVLMAAGAGLFWMYQQGNTVWVQTVAVGSSALLVAWGSHYGYHHLLLGPQRSLAQLKAQQAAQLQAHTERLELALQGADLGLWERDFVTNVRTYSERWASMLGYALQEVDGAGQLWKDLLHPDDRAATRALLSAHLRGDSPTFEAEYRLRHQRGHWVWVLARGRVVARDAAGQPLRMVGTHLDITERKRVKSLLRDSELRLRSLTELSSDWYWEMDEQFRFTRFDDPRDEDGQTETKLSPEIGRTCWEQSALNLSEAQWDGFRGTLQAHQAFRDFELRRIASADAQPHWVSLSGTAVFDGKGVFKGYRGIGRNVTQHKEDQHKIEQLSNFDELTGLPNRRLLTERLQEALAGVARSARHGALIVINLDNFKDLNDTQSHEVGDLLLKQVAARLRESVREIDTVARLGGDEFVVMLKELSPYAGEATFQADGTGKSIMTRLSQPYELQERYFHSTPSIGIALFSDQVQGVDEVLKRADLAMHQAKAAGRNVLRFFDPTMQAAASTRATTEADFRLGLQRQELRAHFQPVVDEGSRVCGVEALVRWQHPQRGLVMPGEFIQVAEQSGLIIPMGMWMLETACRQIGAWSAREATRDLSIAVNVSVIQFRERDFVQQVAKVLRQTMANPYRLKLEITESLLLVDVKETIYKMNELRAMGVSFALDDFGTGYSSLGYLKSLPLDQLKIDQSFVRNVLTDSNDQAIVRTILALARSMELSTVAEGVETEGQRQFLLNEGCDVFQGYLFGRPRPA